MCINAPFTISQIRVSEQFRKWLIDFGDSGYVVRYRIDDDAVTILAIRHQKEVGYS